MKTAKNIPISIQKLPMPIRKNSNNYQKYFKRR